MNELATIDKYVLREVYEEAKAIASRRKELLRRMTLLMENNLEWSAADIYDEFVDDLAKELADD